MMMTGRSIRLQTAFIFTIVLLVIILLVYNGNVVFILNTGHKILFHPNVTRASGYIGRKRVGDFQAGSVQSKKVTTLLLWSPFYGAKNWLQKGLGSVPFENINPRQIGDTKHICPPNQCTITDDRNALNKSDVVIFSCVNHITEKELLKNRRPNQMYFAFCTESSTHVHLNDLDEVGMNAFGSFRLDSDFPFPRGKVAPRYNGTNNSVYSPVVPWANKTKSVVWLVSNCHASDHRELFVKELSKYISVDIYGSCGKPCKGSKCMENFAKEYKFYLAIENSVCKDYVTEKIFLTLKVEMIPIVFGVGNYSPYAPDGSYINVMDYTSPKALADYLNKIGSDKEEYYKYFAWKKTHELVEYTLDSLLCRLCEAAIKKKKMKPAHALESWWTTPSCDNGYMSRWSESGWEKGPGRVN